METKTVYLQKRDWPLPRLGSPPPFRIEELRGQLSDYALVNLSKKGRVYLLRFESETGELKLEEIK